MRTTIAFALLVLAACVSREVSQVPFSAAPRPPAGMALVYLFRTDATTATLDVPAVRIDDKLVVGLHAAEYTAVHVPAGRHTVSSDPDPLRSSASSRPLAFTVAPGQVAGLAMQYLNPPPPQAGSMLESKQGKVEMPRTDTTTMTTPFAWAFVADIEANALAAELRKRHYRAAEKGFAPG